MTGGSSISAYYIACQDQGPDADAEFQDQKRKGLITEVLKGLRRAEEETFGKDSHFSPSARHMGSFMVLGYGKGDR